MKAKSKFSMRREAHFGDRVVQSYAGRPKNVQAMLAEAVARNPQGLALVCVDGRLTWSELEERAARLAAGLAARGVKPGDRVVLAMGNSAEFVIALHGIWMLGAIAVPLGTRTRRPELVYMLNQCGAVALFHDEALAGELPGEGEAKALTLCIGIVPVGDGVAFADISPQQRIAAAASPDEEQPALLMYTSGTTGHPKGAVVTHFNLVHAALTYVRYMELGEADRLLAAVPLSHTTGIAALVMTTLCCAGALVIMPAFQAGRFLQLAERERISCSVLVPAMYNLCLMQPDLERHDLSAWRVGGFGGAPMPVPTIHKLAQRLPRLRLMNIYGATETVAGMTILPHEHIADRPDSVGLAVNGASVAIMDEAGCELPPGEVGELWLGGPTVVKGYWDNPEATAANFTGGFWHSGDLGSMDAQGFVSVVDRKKDMINRGGYKIYTAEVESVLAGHDGVLECAVVARPCPVLGERVHAFVTVGGGGPGAEALRAWCATRLSDYKVPETFSMRTEPLPRNANGKVMKRLLREQIPAA